MKMFKIISFKMQWKWEKKTNLLFLIKALVAKRCWVFNEHAVM